ncbi:MAG: hypothetical protein RLZZ08_1499 [Pseudomonadota bacterium]|jgi:peptidylprolyl isomerase
MAMLLRHLLALPALLIATPSGAESADPPTPASVVAAAPAGDWRAIAPADLLVMTLAPDAGRSPRQVVIQLMPAPFSQPWVQNIRTLAKAHWWDGTTVYRVVDNWVAQWGDGEDDKAKAKALPVGVVSPVADYETTLDTRTFSGTNVPARAEGRSDPYADETRFFLGWPVASNKGSPRAWPVHCYGSVGVARDLAPDTGTGAELYAVIGHAPRALDRNIAVVGRVIEGIEHLSTLPRGKGDAGVYDNAALKVPILSVRPGNELSDPPRFEYLASDSASFARYVAVRANRSDSFYRVPAGGVDICNVQVPIRRVAAPGKVGR